MKQLLLFAAVLISVSAFAQHPTDKGWRSVGGTGSLRIDLDGDGDHNHSFSLSPELYWFVANSFALGADIGARVYIRKSEWSDTFIVRSNSVHMWVAPGVRFYFREPEKAWRPYVFLNAGYQHLNGRSTLRTPTRDETTKISSDIFYGYIGAGVAWFFTDHAAFDLRMRVLDVSAYKNYLNTIQTNWGYGPSFSLGIQAFFE